MQIQDTKKATMKNGIITIIAVAIFMTGVSYIALSKLTVRAAIANGLRQNSALVAQLQTKTTSSKRFTLDDPIHIELPRLKLEKDVLPGTYDIATRTWSLDASHAFFMKSSATPVIYGHATDEVFGSLSSVAKNEPLTVTTSHKKTYIFKYSYDEVVNFTDSHVLRKTYPNSVLLMTCINNEKRRVLHFTFVGEEKNKTKENS